VDAPPEHTHPVQLTVITGLSGAGKTHAMGAFEDAGWFCIDNLPPRLLPALAEMFALDGSNVERAAIVCDARGGAFFDDLLRELDALGGGEVSVSVLFLEADDDVLMKRFSETRRRHPLAEGGAVREGVERERALLAEVRSRSDVVLDTSSLNIWELRTAVSDALMGRVRRGRLLVTFSSFGFKHGPPRDADLVLDVRFLKNPHYVPELAPLTGEDPRVGALIERDPDWSEFRARLESLLDLLLPAYEREGKSHLVVAFGCTGGRHRSVYMARLMGARYADQGFDVTVAHRDVDIPPIRPGEEDR
jgi:UPF0042 nucleotide-binding protein